MNLLELNSGDLRTHIQIQSQTAAPDATTGVPSSGWTTIRDTWARVLTTSAKELFMSAQYTATVTHMVSVRWTPVPLAAGMRVVMGPRTLTVQTVENALERDVRVNLMCVEIDGVIA